MSSRPSTYVHSEVKRKADESDVEFERRRLSDQIRRGEARLRNARERLETIERGEREAREREAREERERREREAREEREREASVLAQRVHEAEAALERAADELERARATHRAAHRSLDEARGAYATMPANAEVVARVVEFANAFSQQWLDDNIFESASHLLDGETYTYARVGFTVPGSPTGALLELQRTHFMSSRLYFELPDVVTGAGPDDEPSVRALGPPVDVEIDMRTLGVTMTITMHVATERDGWSDDEEEEAVYAFGTTASRPWDRQQ